MAKRIFLPKRAMLRNLSEKNSINTNTVASLAHLEKTNKSQTGLSNFPTHTSLRLSKSGGVIATNPSRGLDSRNFKPARIFMSTEISTGGVCLVRVVRVSRRSFELRRVSAFQVASTE